MVVYKFLHLSIKIPSEMDIGMFFFWNLSHLLDFLFEVYRSEPNFINGVVPLLLDSLQRQDSTLFNFTNNTIANVQDILSSNGMSFFFMISLLSFRFLTLPMLVCV